MIPKLYTKLLTAQIINYLSLKTTLHLSFNNYFNNLKNYKITKYTNSINS